MNSRPSINIGAMIALFSLCHAFRKGHTSSSLHFTVAWLLLSTNCCPSARKEMGGQMLPSRGTSSVRLTSAEVAATHEVLIGMVMAMFNYAQQQLHHSRAPLT